MKKIVLALFTACAMLPASAQSEHNFEAAKNLDIFNALYKELDLYYVDTLDAQKLVRAAIDGMLDELDPYTEFYSAKTREDLKQMATGKYAGIGAIIQYNKKTDRCVIGDPFEGMPAAEAGLRPGDVILSIDGKDTGVRGDRDAGDYSQSVSDALRGEPGSSFEIRVQRPGTAEPLTLTLVRRTIAVPAITYYGMVDATTGYILLSEYTENCARNVRRAVVDLKQQGMTRLILDLRNNGGGLMDEAVKMVNLFLPKGKEVLHTRGKIEQMNQTYKTTDDPLDLEMPLVVLVNGGTASAAEITSGALQDYDRAVIMGNRTYGKGLVQQPRELPYGTQMKLTTSKYFIPSGRCVQAYDFKNRNEDGSPKHLPDSLCHEFRTVAGRVVRDGGGIKPDIVVRPDSLPNIAYYLTVTGLDSTEVLLDYEVDYIAKHPEIAPAVDFEISDADYEDFKQRVIESGFTYDPESERALKSLKRIVQFEGYYDDAKTEFENLEKKLKHNIARDLDMNRDVLKQIISSDIVAAYYFQKGAVENSLRHDKQVKAAFDLINNPEKYKSVLDGTYKPADDNGDDGEYDDEEYGEE